VGVENPVAQAAGVPFTQSVIQRRIAGPGCAVWGLGDASVVPTTSYPGAAHPTVWPWSCYQKSTRSIVGRDNTQGFCNDLDHVPVTIMHVLAAAAYNGMDATLRAQLDPVGSLNYHTSPGAGVTGSSVEVNKAEFNNHICDGMCDSESDCADRTVKSRVRIQGTTTDYSVDIPTPNCCSCCADTTAEGTSPEDDTLQEWGDYMWGLPFTKGASTCVPDMNTAWELQPLSPTDTKKAIAVVHSGVPYKVVGTPTAGAEVNPCATDLSLCGNSSCCVDNDVSTSGAGRRHVLSHELNKDFEEMDFEEMDDHQLGLTHIQLGPSSLPSGTHGGTGG